MTLISVILPTFNEADNIPHIIPRIVGELRGFEYDCEVIIVDDASPDGTAERAERLRATYPVHVIKRTEERGLASAVMAGFAASRGDICVVMDADMSHPIEKLADMVEPILENRCDITVGSRYIRGGGCTNWPLHRRLMSRAACFLARGFSPLTDPASGFMAVRRALLEGVSLDPVGWKIVLEVVARTKGRVLEVPIIFADRLYGRSKLDGTAHLQYLEHLWKLYEYVHPSFIRFLKFCIVGTSGVVVDTAILVSCVEIFGIPPLLAAVVAFLFAFSWNYVWNFRWTFAAGAGVLFGRYLRYCFVCLFGFGMRLAVMYLLLQYAGMSAGHWYILASMLGIVAGLSLNYAGSKSYAFRRQLGQP